MHCVHLTVLPAGAGCAMLQGWLQLQALLGGAAEFHMLMRCLQHEPIVWMTAYPTLSQQSAVLMRLPL